VLILFDHGTPRGIARALSGHTVITAYARGWDRLTNGALLHAAEEVRVDLLLTTDRRIRYQQNLTGRKIAILVLTGTTKWSRVRMYLERISLAVNESKEGSYAEVEIPFRELVSDRDD
jgi:hypothetical protein